MSGEPGEGRERLALAPCRQQHQSAVGSGLLQVSDHQALGHVQQAQFGGGLEAVLKAATDNPQPAAMAGGEADHGLDAMNVGGKGGNHDPARGLLEDRLKSGDQIALGSAVSVALGVGGVAEQEEHALVAKPAKLGQVGGVAVDRVLLDLEVTGVDHSADRGVDGQPDCVGDAVSDRDCLDPERADLEAVADPHLAQIGLPKHPMLPQSVLGQAKCERGAVDGRRGTALEKAFGKKGKGADVVLVAVGEDECENLSALGQQVGDVRDHEVDTRHVVVGEHEPGVDDQDLALPLQRPHVQADLAEAAEGNVFQFGHCVQSSRSCPRTSLVVLIAGSGAGWTAGSKRSR